MSFKRFFKPILNIFVISLWILIFYLQFERPFVARTIQNISPTLLLLNLRHRLFWLSWLSIPLLIFAVIKGRAFCWNICPVGLMQDLIPSIWKSKSSTVNRYLFLCLFIASLFTPNLLAILDPLVTFNRMIVSINMIIFAIPIVIIIALNVYRKRFWCFRLCPLGAFLDLLRPKFNLEKRYTLIALGSGFILGILSRFKPHIISDRLLRPPGALTEKEFVERCIRCGSCIGVCPTGALRPVFLESSIEGFLTPKLIPQIGECDEHCNKCGYACPTQAIKRLPLEVKRNVKIGTAIIDRSRCLAWSYNGLCLICKEHCPYLAIKVIKNRDGIPSPCMIPNLCRGCGLCEKVCPARPIRAIKVYNTGAGIIIPQQNNL